jgi:hypothetical protein
VGINRATVAKYLKEDFNPATLIITPPFQVKEGPMQNP